MKRTTESNTKGDSMIKMGTAARSKKTGVLNHRWLLGWVQQVSSVLLFSPGKETASNHGVHE